MVNKSIEEMLLAQYGTTVWAAIKRRAGVTEEVFVSTETYPDELTSALIAAAADCTGLPQDALLQRLGEFWVLHIAPTNYGHLLTAAGDSVEQFLLNVPRLHDRVVLLLPELPAPHFEVADRTPRSLRLRYTGARPHLTPFLVGLIGGIGERLQSVVVIAVEQPDARNGDATTIRVEW